MLIRFVHRDGKSYTLPISQVVVFTDDGRPVATSYELDGAIVHTDATQGDFGKVMGELGIKQKTGPVDLMKG